MDPACRALTGCARNKTFMVMFDISVWISYPCFIVKRGILRMITSAQMRAARALLGIDQKTLARLSGLSVPTIQRMETGSGNVRGVVDSLTKVVEAFDRAGVELIGEGAKSAGRGRGVRLKSPDTFRPGDDSNTATETADR